MLCPRIKGRRDLSGQSSLGTKALIPPHTPTYSPLPRKPRDPGRIPPLSLSPVCSHSRGPDTHLFSWQAEAWRPRLSLLSRRAREGHHVATPILRFGWGCTWLTRLPLQSKDIGFGHPKPGLESGECSHAGQGMTQEGLQENR